MRQEIQPAGAEPAAPGAAGQVVLPLLFHAADHTSTSAQRRFLRATRLRLAVLALAGASGVVTVTVDDGTNYASVVAAAAFFVALSTEVYILQDRPAHTWHAARATAEAVKTLAWRYAVGGEPFGVAARSEADTDRLFIERLRDVLGGLEDFRLPAGDNDQQITASMRALRKAPLAERQDAYERQRIASQRAWYSEKGRWNASWARRWSFFMVVLEAAGGVLAIVKASGALADHDLVFGLTGAGTAAIVAWTQTRQYDAQARAYSVAANELASIQALVPLQDTEELWAAFVRDDSERAISREHSLWRASRGVRHAPE